MIGQDSLSAQDHIRVAEFVEAVAGIQLPEHKRSLIETRLRKRLKPTGHASLKDYLDFALSPAGAATEQPLLIDAITTNKTDFFREPTHFDFLGRLVRDRLAPLQKVGWTRPLSVWSAGCSTGEEPYTLAMVLMELQQGLPGFQFTIEASDIAPSVLKVAEKGIYPDTNIAPIPMPLRRRYLLRSKRKELALIRVGPELREAVHFFPFNLRLDEYPRMPQYDIIFCRNIMIYFNNEDREMIVRQFHGALRPGGLLFIGHSESVAHQKLGFESVAPTIYRRIEVEKA